MLAGIQGWQLVIIAVLAVLLFAGPKLPSMARNLGQSMRIFGSEVKAMKNESSSHTGNTESSASDTVSSGSASDESRVETTESSRI